MRALQVRDPSLELAWAGGFFDGEGYIGCTTQIIRERGYHRLACSVAQTSKEPLIRFQKAVEAGKVYGPYNYGINKKDYWQWNAENTDTSRQVMEKLIPYLCSIKRDQYYNSVTLYEERSNAASA